MRIFLGLVLVLFLANLALYASGHRFLLEQKVVRPGESYVVKFYGDVGASDTISLVCNYWTGVGTRVAVTVYGENGKTECAKLTSDAAA